MIAASAQECGIDLRVKKEPEDGYWSNVWNTKGFSMSSWGGRPTEDMMWSAAFTDDTEWNEAAWGNLVQTDSTVRFNELVRAARSELDAEKRNQCTGKHKLFVTTMVVQLFMHLTNMLVLVLKNLLTVKMLLVTGKVMVTNFLNVGGLHKILIFFVAHLNAPHFFF